MNPQRIALPLLAAASLGIAACGSNSSSDAKLPPNLKQHKQQIVQRGDEIREQAARRAKAAADTGAGTKAIADQAIDDAKARTHDKATQKAMDEVKDSLVEDPTP